MTFIAKRNRRHVHNLKTDLDHLLHNFFDDVGSVSKAAFQPKINLSEDVKHYHLDVDLPGVDREDVAIEYANDVVTIRAEKKEEGYEEGDKNYHRMECHYGSFSRSVHVPNIDQDNAKAKFKNGVLKITLPKKDGVQSKISID